MVNMETAGCQYLVSVFPGGPRTAGSALSLASGRAWSHNAEVLYRNGQGWHNVDILY